jgi:hypothetical protein
MQIKFGEWLPDRPRLNNPGVVIARNVVPGGESYLPLKSFSSLTSALAARPRGAISVTSNADATYGYVGTKEALFRIGAVAHTDATRSSGAYSLGDQTNWNFVKWGDGIIACALEAEPQLISLGSARFADLGGSPPKAKYVAVVGDFVVLGNINDGSAKPTTIKWSGIDDATAWTPSATTLSDVQELRSNEKNGGGQITGLTGGLEYGLIFQEYTIQRMTYSGSPYVFTINEVLPGIGTENSNSITQEGRLIHFLGQDGFYELVDGSNARKIGDQKVDAWFRSDYDSNYPNSVVGASDPRSSLVIWTYPGADSSGGRPNKYIAYNWFVEKWSYGELESEWIWSAISEGYTLEELDNINASIDALGISLDDQDLNSKNLQFSLYNTDYKKGVFSGTALSAQVDTGEFQFNDPNKSIITGTRPLVDSAGVEGGATVTATVGSRESQIDSVSFGSASTPSTHTGYAPSRSNGRYHTIRVSTSGDFNHIFGADVEAVAGGKR